MDAQGVDEPRGCQRHRQVRDPVAEQRARGRRVAKDRPGFRQCAPDNGNPGGIGEEGSERGVDRPQVQRAPAVRHQTLRRHPASVPVPLRVQERQRQRDAIDLPSPDDLGEVGRVGLVGLLVVQFRHDPDAGLDPEVDEV